MIYMVEMDMDLGEREAEWHAWYLAHIKVLLTVPGFRASQRFKAVLPCPAPYLALHQVDSAAIFDSPEYRGRGGPASTGDWRALHKNWRRNLLDEPAASPGGAGELAPAARGPTAPAISPPLGLRSPGPGALGSTPPSPNAALRSSTRRHRCFR